MLTYLNAKALFSFGTVSGVISLPESPKPGDGTSEKSEDDSSALECFRDTGAKLERISPCGVASKKWKSETVSRIG